MAKDEEKLIDEPMTKKDKIIVGTIFGVASVVLIILIAEIALVITSTEQQGRSSPESAFRDMISGMNHGDLTQIYDVSVFGLNMTFSEFRTQMGGILDSEYDIVIKQVNVISKNDMNQTLRDEADSTIPQLETMTGAQVEDYSVVEFLINVTVKRNGETETQDSTGTLLCVQIDSKWYLVFPFEQNMETTPAVSLAKSNVSDGVKVTFISISNNDVGWGDVDIILADDGSFVTWHPSSSDLSDTIGSSVVTFNYSTQNLGPLQVNCSVVDLAGNGGVNGGDFITLTTFGGSTPFSPGVTYTVSLVYRPTSEEMGRIQFTG